MVTRRQVIKLGTYGLTAMLLPALATKNASASPHSPSPSKPAASLLDPATQPKYVNDLLNPLDPNFAFVPNRLVPDPIKPNAWMLAFDLQTTEFNAQIGLRDPDTGKLLTTKLWGYGTERQVAMYPGRTFQVPTGDRILVEQRGNLCSDPHVYDNAQDGGHLWYRERAKSATVLNAFNGAISNYFIRGVDETALVGSTLPGPPYEVALAIQDRKFLTTGEVYPMPGARMTELFGDVILVNGTPWPRLDVEPRQYRFRLLNASSARVYELRVETGTVPQAGTPTPMYVIGTELGLLNSPAPVDRLRIAPGERYDVVVDFTAFRDQTLTVTNTASTPYAAGEAIVAYVSDQVMQFRVVVPFDRERKATTLPANLRPVSGRLPAPTPGAAAKIRKLVLLVGSDPDGRCKNILGPIDSIVRSVHQGPLFHTVPVMEAATVGTTEIWEFYNSTASARPMHMPGVHFRVLNRQNFSIADTDPDGLRNKKLPPEDMQVGYMGGVIDPDTIGFIDPMNGTLFPAVAAPDWERGKKDTAVMLPGQVTRVLVTFECAGKYVYQCPILAQEDDEMMRPYEVIALSAPRH